MQEKTLEKGYIEYLEKRNTFPRKFLWDAIQKYIDKQVFTLKEGAKILDAGCGDGKITAKYNERYKITGVDYQPKYIEMCKKNYPDGEYVKADIEKLPWQDNTFDCVVFNQAIEHLRHPEKALEELSRVTKKNGLIIITTPNYGSPLWVTIERIWFPIFGGNCQPEDIHLTLYTKTVMRTHAQDFYNELDLRTIFFNVILCYTGRKK